MKVAIVSPDDLSVVLFCKGIVDVLRAKSSADIYVISDVFGEDEYYSNVIKSWGVKHIRLKMHRYINPLKDLKYIFSLYTIFRRGKMEVVISNCTKPNIYGAIAARLAGVRKILCSVWGRGSAFVEKDDFKSRILEVILLSLYWLAFKASSRVWFTNVHDFDYFISHKVLRARKTILTNNYVSTQDYQPYSLLNEKLSTLRKELGLKDFNRVVMMVGRLIWAKGIREFVDASKILKDRLPQVKFIFVGPKEEGWADAVPESYMKESEKSGNFLWVGFRKDVKDFYALADLAVLPSYYKEGGFPRALTEAMAMGKPVIAADSADCRGPVEDGKNGYLVPVKDSTALANAIEILMSDDKKRGEFGRYSRLKAERELDEKVIVRHVISEFLSG